MRRFLVLAVLLLLTVFVWGQNEGELTGIWVDSEEQAFFAFIDNMCFLGKIDSGQYGIYAMFTYKFNKNSKILETIYDGEKTGEFGASLSGNNLTISNDGESAVLVKRTDSPAPAAIEGIWKGPLQYVFAFFNDTVFIFSEEEEFLDSGTYTFRRNRGSFKTNNWDLKISFTVSGNTLTASGGIKGIFTRVR